MLSSATGDYVHRSALGHRSARAQDAAGLRLRFQGPAILFRRDDAALMTEVLEPSVVEESWRERER